MIIELNKEVRTQSGRGGVAMIWDDLVEAVNFSRKAQIDINGDVNKSHLRTGLISYSRIVTPDPEKQKIVEEMVEVVRETVSNLDLPSHRRKKTWSDSRGDLNIDRGLEGSDRPYRTIQKKDSDLPPAVTILSNLDGHEDESEEMIFWRGAMSVALSQLLDELGYVTTVWVWNSGFSVYQSPHSSQFNAIRLKGPQEDLDMISLVNCHDSYFMRSCMFGAFAGSDKAIGWPCTGIGGKSDEWEVWKSYVSLPDDYIYQVPIITDRNECIKKTIETLSQISYSKLVKV